MQENGPGSRITIEGPCILARSEDVSGLAEACRGDVPDRFQDFRIEERGRPLQDLNVGGGQDPDLLSALEAHVLRHGQGGGHADHTGVDLFIGEGPVGRQNRLMGRARQHLACGLGESAPRGAVLDPRDEPGLDLFTLAHQRQCPGHLMHPVPIGLPFLAAVDIGLHLRAGHVVDDHC